MGFLDTLVVLGLAVAVVAGAYAVQALTSLWRDPLHVAPFTCGGLPEEHAWSRYHARWYLASMVFLAFDVEMLFMYPWAAVLPHLAGGSVAEMFGFLSVVLVGVLYAAREGAFSWA